MRKDIESLREELGYSSVVSEQILILSRRLSTLESSLDQLNLTLAALIRLMEEQGHISPKTLVSMIQRIDLEDGVEDGVMGPDRTAEAPECAACGRPVNPNRSECIFCGAKLSPGVQKLEAPPRTILCASCQQTVPERDSYFSEQGAVCPRCFQG